MPRQIEAKLRRADGACIVHDEAIVMISGNTPEGPSDAVTAFRVKGSSLELPRPWLT